MKQTDIKKNKWIWYCLYTVALVLFLSYILFPSKDIGDYFKRTVKNINPDLVIDFEKISPALPLGLNLKNLWISITDNPEITVFQSERISLKPKIFSYIKGENINNFSGKLNDGRITGSMQFTESSAGNTMDVLMTMEDIHVHADSGLPSKISDWVEGILNGNITYSGRINTLLSGSGEAEISLSEGMLKMIRPVPILGLNTIEFNECTMVAKLKERKLNITNGSLKGKDMTGNMTGSISLKNDIPESRLNLKVEIVPYPSLFQDSPGIKDTVNLLKKRMKDGKLSFNIIGTIDKPRYNLN